jgi:hypothetical protein
LKLQRDEALSNFAFIFNLRRYSLADMKLRVDAAAAAAV